MQLTRTATEKEKVKANQMAKSTYYLLKEDLTKYLTKWTIGLISPALHQNICTCFTCRQQSTIY